MLRKEGAIHCVSWSPAGDEFICIFGESPPEACIFNLKCEVTFSFGEAPRNTVSWSPHGRFLALAGFGNMAGELSFWDRRATPQVRDRGSHSISASLTYDGGHLPAAQVPLDGRGAHDRRIWLVARLTPLPHCHPLPAPTRRQRLSSASPPARPQRNQPRQTGPSNRPVKPSSHHTPSPHPVLTSRRHPCRCGRAPADSSTRKGWRSSRSPPGGPRQPNASRRRRTPTCARTRPRLHPSPRPRRRSAPRAHV